MFYVKVGKERVSKDFETRADAVVFCFDKGYVIQQPGRGHKHKLAPNVEIVGEVSSDETDENIELKTSGESE